MKKFSYFGAMTGTSEFLGTLGRFYLKFENYSIFNLKIFQKFSTIYVLIN